MAHRSVPLSGHDLVFLGQAATGTPMNVGGLVTFAADPEGLELERLRALAGSRLELVPRLTQRAEPSGGGTVWADDPDFAIERHIDELPFPADDPDLLRHVAELHATELAPDRPPWRLSLMRQGSPGGAALLFRASHALVDGLGSMQVMRAIFDPAAGLPAAAGVGRTDGRRAGQPAGRRATRPDGTGADDDPPDAREVVRDVAGLMSPARPVDLDPERYRQALTLLDGVLSMLDQAGRTTPLFRSSPEVRTRVALAGLPWSDMRRVRRRHGVRFDALGLTLVGGGLARLFAGRGGIDPEARVRTLVPIGGVLHGRRADLGNRSSFLVVGLPIGPMPAVNRLTAIASDIEQALAAGQHRAVAMSLRSLETAPGDAVAAVASFTQHRQFVDLVVSCVPGSRRRLRLGGVAHLESYALLPITTNVPVAVGLTDIGGGLGLAVTANERVLHEVDFLTDGIVRTARELAGATGSTSG